MYESEEELVLQTVRMSRVSDRDLTTQDSIAVREQGGLATEANYERSGFATKLSENRLACCLHSTYYKRPYILLIHEACYKYRECSTVFYCGHEENMHEACGRAKGCDRV